MSSMKHNITKTQKNKAFTLIEVLVSVSIFALVMLVATGAVFSIVQANKKTHTLKSVMTNLNFALEAMTRDIRLGFRYSCNGGADCAVTPGTRLTFKANRDVDGGGYSLTDNFDQIEYTVTNGKITKSILGLSTWNVTADEITITSLKFYVIGTATGDGKQPKVVMILQGNAGTGQTKSDFTIQTTVSQRAIDS